MEDARADLGHAGRLSTAVWTGLAIITALAAVVRLPGLNDSGLFYDDAWFALPSRVPLHTALDMVVTTPGYTVLNDAWIALGPSGNLWPKVLPFVIGVAAVPAIFWLSRVLRLPTWAGLVMSALVAASPAAIEYSVRVKEYEADLLLAIVVLAATEQARRVRSRRSLIVLSAVSVGSVVMSTSLLVAVAGCWVALLAVSIADRRDRAGIVVTGAITAVLCAGPVLFVAGHIPRSLTEFWVATDRLMGAPYNGSHLAHIVALTAGGIAHGFVGTPLPATFPQTVKISHGSEAWLLALGVLELMVFAVMALPSVRDVLRRRVDGSSVAGLASVTSILVAVVLWGVGLVPLGTGRTDLVLLPAACVLLGFGLVRLRRVGARQSWLSATSRRSIKIALVVVACAAGSLLGWHQRSWYPAQDVTKVVDAIDRDLRPGDAIAVTGRNTFTWAFEGLSPFAVHLDRNDPKARTIGFWVTFTPRKVIEVTGVERGLIRTPNRLMPGLTDLPPDTRRLWLIGITYSTYSPSAFRFHGPLARRMVPTGANGALIHAGWHRTTTAYRSPGEIAVLYRR